MRVTRLEFLDAAAKALYLHDGGSDEEWMRTNPARWHGRARAVIAALRNPSDAMLKAMYGNASRLDADVVDLNDRINTMQWQAAIDAALGDRP